MAETWGLCMNLLKVFESYKTFNKCNFLYYANSIEDVENYIEQIKNMTLPKEKTDFSEEYIKLFDTIKKES